MEDVKIRLQSFMEKNRHNIEFIGAQNGKIKEVLALINNTKPNKNHFFVIDGIWAHQKALDNNLEVDSFIFCEEIITSHEGMNLLEAFFENINTPFSSVNIKDIGVIFLLFLFIKLKTAVAP